MPMSLLGYDLLVRLAIQNPSLDAQDRGILKEVIQSLEIQNSDTLSSVNDKWTIQQRMEAVMVYLLVKYESRAAKQQRFSEEVEAAEYLSLPEDKPDGRKYTVEDKRNLIRVEQTSSSAKNLLLEAQELSNLMNKLARTVFARNQKLDHMNVNYRRELSVDEGSY